ncbi:MAG: hypothetical protein IT384_26155 [Deltaproteobacteria bacterium]|nr:hypothetical protein [Deltaproteobacteria bacterium]
MSHSYLTTQNYIDGVKDLGRLAAEFVLKTAEAAVALPVGAVVQAVDLYNGPQKTAARKELVFHGSGHSGPDLKGAMAILLERARLLATKHPTEGALGLSLATMALPGGPAVYSYFLFLVSAGYLRFGANTTDSAAELAARDGRRPYDFSDADPKVDR